MPVKIVYFYMHTIHSFKIAFKHFPKFNIKSKDGMLTLLGIQNLNLISNWRVNISDHHNTKFDITVLRVKVIFLQYIFFHIRS